MPQPLDDNKLALSSQEIAQIQGTLLLMKDGLETIMDSPDLPFPDLLKGIIIGLFLGIPQKIDQSLSLLSPPEEGQGEQSPG